MEGNGAPARSKRGGKKVESPPTSPDRTTAEASGAAATAGAAAAAAKAAAARTAGPAPRRKNGKTPADNTQDGESEDTTEPTELIEEGRSRRKHSRKSMSQGNDGTDERTMGDKIAAYIERARGKFLSKLTEIRIRQKFGKTLESTIAEEFLTVIRSLEKRLVNVVAEEEPSTDASEVSKQLTELQNSVNLLAKKVAKINSGNSKLTKREKEAGKEQEKRKTYADRVKEGLTAEKKKTLLIQGGNNETADAVKEVVLSTIKPTEDGIKVTAMRKSKSGVLVTVADDASWTTVSRHQGLRDKGLRVQEPEKRMPRIAVYGMDRSYAKEEITGLVYKQNFRSDIEEDKFKQGFIPLYKTGRKDLTKGAWVVRVSPEIRDMIMKAGRIYIGWDSCRVEDEAGIMRCFRCQSYGHLSTKCKAEEVCSHCAATGHDRKTCPQKSARPICANCRRVGRSADHDVTSKTCPCYERQLDAVARTTDYRG